MAKLPVAGRVKTRLSRQVGAVAAAWWYRHQLRRLLRRLRDPRWELVLALTPDGVAGGAVPSLHPSPPSGRTIAWGGAPSPRPSPPRGEGAAPPGKRRRLGGGKPLGEAPDQAVRAPLLPLGEKDGVRGHGKCDSPAPRGWGGARTHPPALASKFCGSPLPGAFRRRHGCRIAIVAQGGGDLGRRMLRAIGRMPPGPVLVVGSDVPGLTRAHVRRAFQALGRAEVVLGPAPDGGYWAMGSGRIRRLRLDLLADVRWSSPHALADTVAALAGRRIAFADTLADVDTAADLRMVAVPPAW